MAAPKYKVLRAVSGDLSATGMSETATTIKVEQRAVKWVNKLFAMQKELDTIIPRLMQGDIAAKSWMDDYTKVWDICRSMVSSDKYFYRTTWEWVE